MNASVLPFTGMKTRASVDEIEQTIKELLDKPLDADTAVQIALLHNRRLQATYEEIGIAQAAIVEAGTVSNPTFHGGAALGLPADPMTAHPAHDHYVLEIEMDFLSMLYASIRKVSSSIRIRGGNTSCDGCRNGIWQDRHG